MSTISTHVLDAVLGKPAEGIAVQLDRLSGEGWVAIGAGATNSDGRCQDLCESAGTGTYKLTFRTAPYFDIQRRVSIYPDIVISFVVDGLGKYHIPLLLSDNSYTTYRGS